MIRNVTQPLLLLEPCTLQVSIVFQIVTFRCLVSRLFFNFFTCFDIKLCHVQTDLSEVKLHFVFFTKFVTDLIIIKIYFQHNIFDLRECFKTD